MFRTLIILPDAEKDAANAYNWYEQQEPGLGEEFLRCIDARIQLIRRNPEIYQVVHETYRKAIVRRFPYVIFYDHSETIVTVYAVLHCSQNPKKWQSQLGKF